MSLQDIYKEAGVVMKPAAMKDGKLYSQQPHSGAGDFNFSRADGVQTRINKHGLIETVANNEPRLSYSIVDGKVGDCPHLLLEPSRTNLVLESENFNNYFTKISSATITSNDIIAPDGSQSGDKLTKGTAPLCLRRSSQVSIGIQYAFSVYAKKGSVDKIQLDIGDAGIQEFTLTDEWQRFEVTATPPTFTHIDIEMPTGSSGDYIYLFGAQVEQGSYATSYIPTEGSSVTRVAPICKQDLSQVVSSNTHTIYWEGIAKSHSGNDGFAITFSESDTNINNAILLYRFSNGKIGFYGSLNQSAIFSAPLSESTASDMNTVAKYALAIENNRLSIYRNGTKIISSTATQTIPTNLKWLQLNRWNNISALNTSTYKDLRYYNTALTDTELQNLTS